MKAIVLPLLTVLAVPVHAQQPVVRRPASTPVAGAPARPGTPQLTATERKALEFDSTGLGITDIGTRVAELRGVYELYQRAGFNEPDGSVMERATMLGDRCRSLATSVARARRVLCRSCLSARAQPPVDQYRAYLPSLERMAEQCAARISALKSRGTISEQSNALRKEVTPLGARLVQGMRPYESRLIAVRQGMGWATPVNTGRP